MPGYESLLLDLKQLCERTQSSTRGTPADAGEETILSGASVLAALEEAKAHGLLIWKFTFSPTRELDAQGVNVNSVREELSKIGEILKATPTVKSKDKLIFEFLVSTHEAPADLSLWEAKGITVEPAEPETDAHPASRALIEEAEHNPFLAFAYCPG